MDKVKALWIQGPWVQLLGSNPTLSLTLLLGYFPNLPESVSPSVKQEYHLLHGAII